MFDYRLFFPHTPVDERRTLRRPAVAPHLDRRLFRLPGERRDQRQDGHR